MVRIDGVALWAFVRLGWRRAWADKATTIGVVLLYWLILIIFWGLWQATSSSELFLANTSPSSLFWYLVVTECIACSVGWPYRIVEAEIGNGNIGASLLRPIPYAMATLAEWFGQTCYRAVVLIVAGSAAGLWITGVFPLSLSVLPVLLLSIAIGCLSVLLCQLQIGYAAAWVGSSAPIFWVWQKLLFVLGGLVIPLTLYPSTLRVVARALPFSSMLFAPGSLLLQGFNADFGSTLALQFAWLIALGVIAWLIDRAAATRFATRGI